MDITFCTLYFDIDRKNWKEFNVSNETYMDWFANLLSLDIKLYILTEKKFVDRIIEMRKNADPELKKTIIKETTIEELPSYRLYNERLEKLMLSEEFQNTVRCKGVPEMTKPLYNVLMFNKIHHLQKVSDENPFNTEYFSWIDAGFIRNSDEVKNMKRWPDPSKLKLQRDKIRFFCMSDQLHRHIKNINWHVMSQTRLLKGAPFFLHKDLIPFIREQFDANVNKVLNENCIGSDEKIFDICCLDNPTKFDLWRCHWRDELRTFAYDVEKSDKPKYEVTVEWNESEIEKSNDYKSWFFCIEDENHELIFREDYEVNSPETYEMFKNFKKTYIVSSDKLPTHFVIWPVSKSKGFMRYVRKPTQYLAINT